MSQSCVIPLMPITEESTANYEPDPIELYELSHEEQFVLWVLRNWLRGTNRWARLWSGVCGYLGEEDSADAMRAFGDMMLCLKYNGRRTFLTGAPGCPVTPDELALMTLTAALQNEDAPLAEGLVCWLARPAAQQVLMVSAAKFAELLESHGLQLPNRVLTNLIEYRDAV